MQLCSCQLLLCLARGRMRPRPLCCGTEEQSKLPGRSNGWEQNKFSLNMFSSFRKSSCRMHSPALESCSRGSGAHNSSPEGRGKDPGTALGKLPQQRAGGDSPQHQRVMADQRAADTTL